MRRPQITRRSLAVVAVALAALLLTMIVTASADVSDSTIFACVKKSGVPRIVAPSTTCKSTETALSWNASGPPGEKGERGERGEPGPGTVVYAVDNRSATEISGETTLVSKSVPAGHYSVTAKAWIVGSSKAPARAGALCFLYDSPPGHPGEGTTVDIGSWASASSEYEPGRSEGAATVTLQGVATVSTAGELVLRCRSTSDGGASMRSEDASIDAIQASEVH